MPVTRAPDVSVEVAQLFQAFNHCANGHDMGDVIEAAAQVFAAGIHNYAAAQGMTKDQMLQLADGACHGIIKMCDANWQREPQPNDIEVKMQ